jgi:hypothetical protein
MPNLAKISKISVDHHLQNHSGYIISFYICNIVGPGCVFYECNHSLNSSVLAELEVTFTISLQGVFFLELVKSNQSSVVELPKNSYKPITNTECVRARFCKLQKRVHSTRSRE